MSERCRGDNVFGEEWLALSPEAKKRTIRRNFCRGGCANRLWISLGASHKRPYTFALGVLQHGTHRFGFIVGSIALDKEARKNRGEVAEDSERVEREHQTKYPSLNILGFVWLALLVLEFTRGLNPALEALGTTIWIIFVVDFSFRIALAERKWTHIKRNWLTAISLLVPALRFFRCGHLIRVLRLGRTARGVRLFRVLSSLNRGVSALGKTMGGRGFGLPWRSQSSSSSQARRDACLRK